MCKVGRLVATVVLRAGRMTGWAGGSLKPNRYIPTAGVRRVTVRRRRAASRAAASAGVGLRAAASPAGPNESWYPRGGRRAGVQSLTDHTGLKHTVFPGQHWPPGNVS